LRLSSTRGRFNRRVLASVGRFRGRGGWAVYAVPGFREAAAWRGGAEFFAAALHPDGVLLGIAVEGARAVQIFDLSGHAVAVSVRVPDGGTVRAFDFAPTGHFLAVASDESVTVVNLTAMKPGF
jgi:hypothetical protein